MTLTVTEMTYNLLFVFITLYLTYLQDFVNAKGKFEKYHFYLDILGFISQKVSFLFGYIGFHLSKKDISLEKQTYFTSTKMGI